MGNVLVWAIWVLAAIGCLGSGVAVISFSNFGSSARETTSMRAPESASMKR